MKRNGVSRPWHKESPFADLKPTLDLSDFCVEGAKVSMPTPITSGNDGCLWSVVLQAWLPELCSRASGCTGCPSMLQSSCSTRCDCGTIFGGTNVAADRPNFPIHNTLVVLLHKLLLLKMMRLQSTPAQGPLRFASGLGCFFLPYEVFLGEEC
jgi:hypothetical protein